MGLFNRRRPSNNEGDPVSPPPQAGTPAPSEEPRRPNDGHAPRWTGRGLKLPFPPDVDHAAALAQTFVDAAKNVDGVNLDYSAGSLVWIDGFLERMSEYGSDAVAETIFTAGCYVGEVFVRAHQFEWIATPAEHAQAYGFPITVRGPAGNVANPLGKVFKRVDNGLEDNIPYFAHVMTQPNQ